MELPLLEGGVYICCPSSEEEVSLGFEFRLFELTLFSSWIHNLLFIASFHTVSKLILPLKNRSKRNAFNQCFFSFKYLAPSLLAKTSGAKFTCKANLQSSEVLWWKNIGKSLTFLNLSGVRGQFQAPGRLKNHFILLWKPAYHVPVTIDLLPFWLLNKLLPN